MGAPFYTMLPLTEEFLQAYAAQLLAEGVSATTARAQLSAMGTLGTWCGYPRITSEFLKYVLKGEGASSGPMEKVRVHNLPWQEAKAAVDAAVAAVDDSTPWLRLRFMGLGCL